MARWLATRIETAEAATMPGRLLAIAGGNGWFPALVRGRTRERCHGTLARVALRPGDLARLDRYEGREYRRSLARVRIADGTLLTVVVYRWRAPRPSGARIIPDGDFLAWLERTGQRAFTTRSSIA